MSASFGGEPCALLRLSQRVIGRHEVLAGVLEEPDGRVTLLRHDLVARKTLAGGLSEATLAKQGSPELDPGDPRVHVVGTLRGREDCHRLAIEGSASAGFFLALYTLARFESAVPLR